jgi:hypothetical protein
MDLKDI